MAVVTLEEDFEFFVSERVLQILNDIEEHPDVYSIGAGCRDSYRLGFRDAVELLTARGKHLGPVGVSGTA